MTDDLAGETCTACRGGEPTLTEAQVADLLPRVPGWRVATVAGVPRIERTFTFPDVLAARVNAIASS